MVVMNGVPLGNKVDLAVALAEELGTTVYLAPAHWTMFAALQASGYPLYNGPRYNVVGTDPHAAMVHLLDHCVLDTVQHISATMEDLVTRRLPCPASATHFVCLQTMGYVRTTHPFWHSSGKVQFEPTTFSDHSTQLQLQNFCSALIEMGFDREKVFLLSKYGDKQRDALARIWPEQR